jgi:hypothetical protein
MITRDGAPGSAAPSGMKGLIERGVVLPQTGHKHWGKPVICSWRVRLT